MHINFTGHHLNVTNSLKAFTEDKFSKLERHFDKITAIKVSLNVEKLSKIAEATVLVAKGELHARVEADDMYGAIDALADKLHIQLMKHKDKMRTHH